ncbi:MAG: putative glycoside hydrolase, partial [Thermoproteota archaeon]
MSGSKWWDKFQARFGVMYIQDFLSLDDFNGAANAMKEAHCNGVLNACVINDFVPQGRLRESIEAFENKGLRMVVMVTSFYGEKSTEHMGIPFPYYYIGEDIEGRKSEWVDQLTGKVKNVMWCPVRPERRRKLVEICSKLTELGVHGIMLDYIRYGGSSYCYCGYCRERMLRDGINVDGLSLKDTVDPKNPIRQKITSWRAERITSIVKEIRDKVKGRNPDVALGIYTVNHSYPEINLFSLGQDFEKLSGIVDFIMPGSYYTELHGSTWPGVVAEYMKALSRGAKIWVGLASYRLRTGQMLKLNIYEALAHGADGVIEFGGSPPGVKSHDRPHHWTALGQAFKLMEEMEDRLSEARIKPLVAPYSLDTVSTRGIFEGIEYTNGFREMFQAFMGIGIPIAVGKPEESRSGMVLTGLEALTKAEAEKIEKRVMEEGLGLLAFFQSGLYTITERNKCVKEPLLINVLGDDYGEPPSLVATAKIVRSNHPALEEFRRVLSEEAYPIGERRANIKPITSKVLIRTDSPETVLLTANTPGNGRVVHFSWLVAVENKCLKDQYSRLYKGASLWVLKEPLAYVKSNHNLDLTLRGREKNFSLCLVNTMSGPTLYNPVAVRDIEVYLAVPAEQVDSAMTLKGADVQVEPLGRGVILKIS